MPGDEPRNLKSFVLELRSTYKKLGLGSHHAVTWLSKTMLRKTKNPTPCLTGLRAVQIKHLAPVVAEVFKSKYNPTNPQHRDMLEGLAASEKVDQIIGRNMMN